MARRSQWASLLFLSFSAPLRLCARYLCVACATWRLTGKIEPDDRMPPRPVPPIMDIQPPKQRFAAVEQLIERIEEQALAEAPRTRQEVILARARHRPGMRGLVDVDIAFLDDLAEGLDTDRELLQRRCHWARPRHGRHAPSLDLARYRGQPCPQPAGDRPSLLMGSPTRRDPPSRRCRPLRTHDGPSNAAWSAQRTLQSAATAARITMDPQNPQGPLCGPSALPAPAARRCFRPLASLLADIPGSNRGHVRPLEAYSG